MEDILNKITPSIKEDMETIFFTSDLHADHAKIISICNRPIEVKDFEGEKDLHNKEYKLKLNEVHNKWIIDNVINKYVSKKDILYILGDVSLARREEAEKFIDKLNGSQKHLVIGNHDKNIHNSTRFNSITQIKDFTYSKGELNIHIVLCHYPMLSWNRKVHGSLHLFGHCHGRLKTNDLSMDVGIDSQELHSITGGICRPLNLFEIVTYMSKKKSENNNYELSYES